MSGLALGPDMPLTNENAAPEPKPAIILHKPRELHDVLLAY